ncbi:MAG TPA: hypothetical protein VGK56_12490 [Anaerolineales bacterium]
MRDVTPEAMKCAIGASCPSLFEVTPEAAKCGALMSSCPAIYEQQDGYLIIAKSVASIPDEIKSRVGQDEVVVWVPRGLVKPGDGHDRDQIPETIAPAAQIQGLADETSG